MSNLRLPESQVRNNNNNFITLEHPHGSYLASKPPMRKNKDYRPRPRNSVVGFSVYKTDAPFRHWYNFLDILKEDNAPGIRYPKCIMWSYGTGIALAMIAGLYLEQIYDGAASKIVLNRLTMSSDFTKPSFFSIARKGLSGNHKYGAFLAFVCTSHLFLTDRMT
jgi:hypothetical protein